MTEPENREPETPDEPSRRPEGEGAGTEETAFRAGPPPGAEPIYVLPERRGTKRLITAALAVLLAGIPFGIGLLVRPLLVGEKSSAEKAAAGKKERKIKHWTCAMHPQVNLPEPGFCPICKMELVPVYEEEEEKEKGGEEEEMAPPRRLKLSRTAVALAEIQTDTARRRLVEAEVRMTGKVVYDETRLAYVTAWVPGRIDRLFVDYTGVAVRKGDHMVYLYSPELYQAQEELLEAVKAVGLFESKAETEAAAGRPEPQILERARRTLEAAEEKLHLWGLEEEQIKEVKRRVTPSDHMTIYAPIGGIVIHKDGLEGMYVQTGTRIYTIADLRQVWVMLDAYESDQVWLRYGQKVTFTTESYPGEVFEGRIAFIDPFLNEKTRTFGVRVNVPNEDGRLKPGMFVRALVRVKVAEEGKIVDPELAGKWICPMHPDVVKDEAGACDLCGMPLESAESLGFVGTGTARPPLVIPASAPLITGKRAVVYLQLESDKGPTFEGKEIVLGPRAGRWYIVRAGLEEGERVVTRGNFKLDSELQIRAKPSMMSPEGGGGAPAHHHGGGPKKAAGAEPGEKPDGKGLPVPRAFRRSLGPLLASTDAVRLATERGDPVAIREAYRMLDAALRLIDPSSLEGHARMAWREREHALKLDAAEGTDVRDADDARLALERLERDRKKLLEAFGPIEGLAGPAASREAEGHLPLPETFRAGLARVLDAYLRIGDRLASDDARGAREACRTLKQALDGVEAGDLPEPLSEIWGARKAEVARGAKGMEAEKIEAVRRGFALASDAMRLLLRRLGRSDGREIHAFRCPMAFGGRGAVWLAAEREVRNPYFGASMLRCGEIVETWKGSRESEGGAGHHE